MTKENKKSKSEENKTSVEKKFHCIDKRCKFPFKSKKRHQQLHSNKVKSKCSFIRCLKPQGKTCQTCKFEGMKKKSKFELKPKLKAKTHAQSTKNLNSPVKLEPEEKL